MWAKTVQTKLSSGGVIGASFKVQGSFSKWDHDLVMVGTNQVCRGMTKPQLTSMLQMNQLTQTVKSKVYEDVEHSDIGRQVIRGGDPNLLSLTRNMATATYYGAVIIGCLPAVFTQISKQAKWCPQMCEKEQKKAVERILQGGDYYKEAPDVTKITIECDELCAVVGNQKGVSFGGMYEVDKFIEKIFHVMGTGRSKFGLVPTSSCLVETFHNPNYHERALAIEIVLTKDKEHLEILMDGMAKDGELAPGHRVLTVDDAALIMSDPELQQLATTAAGTSGTMILQSVPKKLHGPEMLEYLKTELLRGILKAESSPKDHTM